MHCSNACPALSGYISPIHRPWFAKRPIPHGWAPFWPELDFRSGDAELDPGIGKTDNRLVSQVIWSRGNKPPC